jgi:hypothetical protein
VSGLVARLPAALFGIVLGTMGLGNAWRLATLIWGTVRKLVGSRRDCVGCLWAAGGFEPLTKAGTERPVVSCAADLQHQVGASPRPAHLLGLVHPAIDQEIRRTLRHCSPDAHASTMSCGVVDKPGALAAKIVVDFMKRMAQFSGCCTSGSMTSFPFVRGIRCALERVSGRNPKAVLRELMLAKRRSARPKAPALRSGRLSRIPL